jgi:hydrogenase maturation protein HypF
LSESNFRQSFSFKTANIQHPTSNIQHPTSNIQHPTSNIKHPTSNIQHPTSNIQHPTSNTQHPTSTLQTYHIHIQGIVQGVGFRPFVYQKAVHHGMKGWVNNTNDGVHIQITDQREQAELFLKDLLDHLPPLAIVTHHAFEQTDFQDYTSFEIVESTATTQPKLLVTPDVALCEDCRNELHNPDNRRYQYPFITCTNCGPRYSIIQKLPYDRPYTTMQPFEMCPVCLKEYHNPMERRHFSQTNSCPDCAIEMQLYEMEFQIPIPIGVLGPLL